MKNNHDPTVLSIPLFKLPQPEVKTMPELSEQFVVAKSSPLNKYKSVETIAQKARHYMFQHSPE
jgi:hypothetical protein